MRPEMREQLKAAADRSGKSLNQEILRRLNSSLDRERQNNRDQATGALCFLFASLAYSIHWNTKGWRSDVFLFQAIKLGIAKILDALEPRGEPQVPRFWTVAVESDAGSEMTKFDDERREELLAAISSPEAMADFAAQRVLADLRAPRHPSSDLVALREAPGVDPFTREVADAVVTSMHDDYYDYGRAQRHLQTKGEKP
jgi:hypothetical protein